MRIPSLPNPLSISGARHSLPIARPSISGRPNPLPITPPSISGRLNPLPITPPSISGSWSTQITPPSISGSWSTQITPPSISGSWSTQITPSLAPASFPSQCSAGRTTARAARRVTGPALGRAPSSRAVHSAARPHWCGAGRTSRRSSRTHRPAVWLPAGGVGGDRPRRPARAGTNRGRNPLPHEPKHRENPLPRPGGSTTRPPWPVDPEPAPPAGGHTARRSVQGGRARPIGPGRSPGPHARGHAARRKPPITGQGPTTPTLVDHSPLRGSCARAEGRTGRAR